MLFNSYSFMLFFPVVTLLFFIIPKSARCFWLLVASYFFYMSWKPSYVLLIMGSTVVTYYTARLMETRPQNKDMVIWGSVVINIAVLFLFKYFDFLLLNFNYLLNLLHLELLHKPFDLLLPVGISFYTFQAVGYIVDVYRGEIKAERNLFRYALFVSFFPQLVAGPIERSKNLLPQMHHIEAIHVWDYERVTQGLVLMLWGFFLKMVIADRAAIFVDQVYSFYWMYGSIECILAAVLFSIQIYCDFAGYSFVAIGAAQVMGFRLMENFNAPYYATSIREFWKRWHISLSTWFRDYLYIPLGGNRVTRYRQYSNLMFVFLVSGLWHGASWNFVLWGGIHGTYMILENVIKPYAKRFIQFTGMRSSGFGYCFLRMVFTFSLVTFAWIFFRMNNFQMTVDFIGKILTDWNPWVLFDDSLYRVALSRMEWGILIVAIIFLFLGDLVRELKGVTIERFLHEECLPFRWGVLLLLCLSIAIVGIYGPEYDPKQFIYFQF